MAVRVLLPNAFQKHTNNVREISSGAANLLELVTDIEGRFPALRPHLRGEDGQIRRFINFYVNEEDIRFLGNEKYNFQEGDEVLVIPSIAGGCEEPQIHLLRPVSADDSRSAEQLFLRGYKTM